MDSFLKTGKLNSSELTKKSTSTSTKRSAPTPWVEKYRPRTMTDVASQDEVVSVLKKSLTGADLPNLLFYGPPGTGKTSTILAAARDLFGPEMYKTRILELNASDERGISVVRDKVKRFAQTTASGKRPDGKPCPPFKIIILDEADSMTRDAQSALRRTMEKEGRSTKFCLICNYVSRIIEPLTSRCAKFRFKPLAKGILTERLEMIAKSENLNVETSAMEALIETSEGDLRKAITSLQSCARLKGTAGTAITREDVYELSGVVPEKWISGLIKACKSNSYEQVHSYVDSLMCEGFSVNQIIDQLHIMVIEDGLEDVSLNDKQKSDICEALAVSENCLLDGANEFLQLMDVVTVVMKSISKGDS